MKERDKASQPHSNKASAVAAPACANGMHDRLALIRAAPLRSNVQSYASRCTSIELEQAAKAFTEVPTTHEMQLAAGAWTARSCRRSHQKDTAYSWSPDRTEL